MHICINQLAKAYYTRGDVPYGSTSSRYDVIDSMMKILDCTLEELFEVTPIILHPPEARPPILPLPKWMPAEFSLPTSPLSSNILKVIISRFCFLAISLT